MRIEFLANENKNELIVNAYDKNENLLKSETLSAELLDEFDIKKILKFLKMLQAIINKLLELYCNSK
jgi:hypothetical protein